MTYPPRPGGELIWVHVPDTRRLAAIRDLAARLAPLRPGARFLITVPPDVDPNGVDRGDDVACILTLGDDHPDNARDFLNHWMPDLGLWAGGVLLVNHIVSAGDAGVAMLLLDADAAVLRQQGQGWMAGPIRHALARFASILAVDPETQAFLRKNGVSASRIQVSERLHAGIVPTPCAEADLTEATERLAGRPLWLAALLPGDEAPAVLAAHRHALRLSHRLMLIVVPADPGEIDDIVRAAAAAGLRLAPPGDLNAADDNTQLFIADAPEDLAIWLRVAPLCFLGGTLETGQPMANALEAAALGSAVLFGPNSGSQSDACAKLAEAGAARPVRDGDTLGEAVVQLSAPDRVAQMALAGWNVVTEGAELTEQLLDLIQDKLDLRKVAHARA